MHRRAVISALAALGAVGVPSRAGANESRRLYFAGHAFLRASNEIAARMPLTAAALNGAGGEAFSRALFAAAPNVSAPRLPPIQTEQLGEIEGRAEALGLALALDQEVVRRERQGDLATLAVEVWAQALVFDFRARAVTAAFPFSSRFVDAGAGIERAPGAIDTILNGSGASNLQAAFWKTLSIASLPQQATRRLRVSEVTFAPAALAALQSQNQTPERIADDIATHFGAILTSRQNLPILPHAIGAAIGATLPMRFSDATVYQLAVPAADYHVRLRVEDFRRVVTRTAGLRQAIVYGTFLRVDVVEPLSQRVLFSGIFRKGAQRTVLIDADLAEWPSYYETLLLLLNDLCTAPSDGYRDWERDHLVSPRSETSSLRTLQEIFAQCR